MQNSKPVDIRFYTGFLLGAPLKSLHRIHFPEILSVAHMDEGFLE